MKTFTFILLFVVSLTAFAQTICDKVITAKLGENETLHPLYNTDVWFSYTPTKNCKVTISSVGLTEINTYVLVYKGCDVADYYAFNNNYNTTYQSQLTVEGVLGIPIYIRWMGLGLDANTNYKWTIAETDVLTGDFCSNAYEITQANNVCTHTGNNDQWFKYTALTNDYIIISSDATTASDTKCAITSGCGVYEYDFHTFKAGVSSKFAINAEKGKAYYVKWEGSINLTTYNWSIAESTIERGDKCSLPFIASHGFNTSNHATMFSQWFTYTAVNNGTVTVSSLNLTDTNTSLEVFSDCSPHYRIIKADDASGTPQTEATFTVAAGKSYFIKWWCPVIGYSYNWSLIDNTLAKGDDCTLPLRAVEGFNRSANTTSKSQWFKYTPAIDGAVTITVPDGVTAYFDYACGGAFTQTITSASHSPIDLTTSQSIYIHLTYPNLSEPFNWTITLAKTTPGFTCGNSLPADVEQYTTLKSASAVWYCYISHAKANVSIATTASTNSTVSIFKSCDQAALKTVTNPFATPATLDVEEGDKLFIKWEGLDADLNWEIKSTTTAITSAESQAIVISPNPVAETCVISGLSGQSDLITILSLDGKVVYRSHTNELRLVVPCNKLSAGIYQVIIQNDNAITKLKMVKQ